MPHQVQVCTETNKVWRGDLATGSSEKNYTGADVNDLVYIGDEDGVLHAIDRNSGSYYNLHIVALAPIFNVKTGIDYLLAIFHHYCQAFKYC